MDCYKLMVTVDRFSSKSSRKVAISLIRKLCKQLHEVPHRNIGMAFIESDTFPKVYYFSTFNKPLLGLLVSTYQVDEVFYPIKFIQDGKKVSYLGERSLISRNCNNLAVNDAGD